MIQTNASGIMKRKEHARKGHERMKRRLISLVLVLMLVMTAGCGKKSTTKKLKTEDLDEATLQGMAKDITKEMSLKNKIGQLFMVSVYQLDEAESKNQTSVTSQMKKTLKKYPAGGVIMFAKNIDTPDQTKKMTDDLQDASYIPLFMAVDEEGGQVSRVASNPKMKMTAYPSAQEVGRTYNNKKIAQMGKTFKLTISGFEQSSKKAGRKYNNWSGTTKIVIPEGMFEDKTGNQNDETEMQGDFVDFVKPQIEYSYTENDINKEEDSVKLVFDVIDKYYKEKELELSDLNIKMTVDDNRYDILSQEKVTIELTSTDIRETLNITKNGEVKKSSKDELIGKRYTLKISNLTQMIKKAGRSTLDYSGILTVAIKKDAIIDKSENGNNGKTLTVGLTDINGNTSGEIVKVDTVKPIFEPSKKVEIEEIAKGKAKATMEIKGTDTYYETSTIQEGTYTGEAIKDKIKLYVDGQEAREGITFKISNINTLTENRFNNGTESSEKYGIKFTLEISGFNIETNTTYIELQEGIIKDTSGNKNKTTKMVLGSTLKTVSTENTETSSYLGITQIQRKRSIPN